MNLNPYQFGGGNEYVSPEGHKYRMGINRAINTVTATSPDNQMSGYLEYHDTDGDPESSQISSVTVIPEEQRKGIAAAMFDYARANGHPDLHHSRVLSSNGSQFAANTPRSWQPQLQHVPLDRTYAHNPERIKWPKSANPSPESPAEPSSNPSTSRDVNQGTLF